jgi:hypothetical protein
MSDSSASELGAGELKSGDATRMGKIVKHMPLIGLTLAPAIIASPLPAQESGRGRGATCITRKMR